MTWGLVLRPSGFLFCLFVCFREHMLGDSGFWLCFWFVLQSFLVLLRGRRSGGFSVGKERVSCSLVGLAAWYFRGSPIVCYFCLLFLGVTVVCVKIGNICNVP